MMRYVFFLCACMSVVAVLTICVFLFANGIPTMAEIGFGDFLLGMKWKPSKDLYGIFPMIVGSLYVTAGGHSRRGAAWAALRGVYGAFLPQKAISGFEADDRFAGGYSVYRLRLLWPYGHCPENTADVRRQRKRASKRFHSSRHYDPAYHYRRGGIRDPRGARKLL